MRIVFVHGWSVTNTNTYGGLPQALRKNAPVELDVKIDLRREDIDHAIRHIHQDHAEDGVDEVHRNDWYLHKTS